MRNDDGSAVLHGAFEGLLDELLAVFVESTCCFIKKENLRFSDESSCDCDSLLLASREFTSLQAAHSFKAVG